MKCLKCYKDSDDFYHKNCANVFFKSKKTPILNYTLEDIEKLAKKLVQTNITIPGVQPKLSLHLDKSNSNKMTIVGFEGDFILKPQAKSFIELPENEDLTMCMAELCGIRVVPHTLIKLKSGELAYITRRIDRIDGNKIHMEDMCQILGNQTDAKYRGSMEKVGKAILKYSSLKGIDIVSFFEVALFSYLVGNSDMHLKNFSLIEFEDGFSLSPAYDLLSVRIVLPEDREEMALTLNGKKNKILKNDFIEFGKSINLSEKVIQNSFEKFKSKLCDLKELVKISFLSEDLKKKYSDLLNERFKIFST